MHLTWMPQFSSLLEHWMPVHSQASWWLALLVAVWKAPGRLGGIYCIPANGGFKQLYFRGSNMQGCRVGENWWYRGEHCEEYVSEPLVVGIAIASVAGFLAVAAGIIFFLARTLREQYDTEDTEDPLRRGDSAPTLERATKFNPMFESDPVTTQYYRRYDDDRPQYSSPTTTSNELSSEEVRHIYQNMALTKEEIQERLRIIELCARDQHFADFVRQTQVFLERRGSSTT